MSKTALGRLLQRHGFILSSRDGFFNITDASTNCLVHDGGADGFPHSLEQAVELAKEPVSQATVLRN